MKERPILFDTEMVQAIFYGVKTQTRRVLKPQPFKDTRQYPLMNKAKECLVWSPRKGVEWLNWGEGFDVTIHQDCPYGQPGDRLWVREKFTLECPYEHADGCGNPQHVIYWARESKIVRDSITSRWRPSIFMPRWASRLTLIVTGVRVEQVQSITWKDARAEGAKEEFSHLGGDDDPWPIGGFVNLWDSINTKRGFSWESNPWVWVVEFEKQLVLPKDNALRELDGRG